jgi:hypothetical protein
MVVAEQHPRAGMGAMETSMCAMFRWPLLFRRIMSAAIVLPKEQGQIYDQE